MTKDAADDIAAKERRRAAIAWWTRLDAGAPSPAERAQFAAWLTRDPANKAAFDDICCLWGDVEIIREAVSAPTRARPGFALPRPGWRSAAALGAVALALALSFDELSIRWRATALTGAAELRAITLEDGSRVELGPDTAVVNEFSADERRLTLLKGEAFFNVASDPLRPFRVSVPAGTVTALGTAFDIAIQGARTEVTVTRHSVRVAGAGPSVIVEEGAQSAFGKGVAAVAPYGVDADHVTAWRRGKLIFDDKPLGEVVAILARYHHGFLIIVDPTIRGRRVNGVFETRDPMAALRAIEKSLGLKLYSLGSVVLLGG
ncbi:MULTISPECIES: FecR family protein [Methylosinus]|uniref:Iron dicitrate transport regulator FecR n=1 Tax=Methylosinus trichosporium (strain ATCC 35070 / NCIMB 11131 / UNIQEM 75 / OB3b) TaxID=595536 RepID=A0A2D2D5J7_METT3|nr:MULTISPECIES: FecR family protein [Methylosinus]ATQ70242.1 iron dicitrate transport regulator FecR [Methylosinus trichosporium OB3b]OBS51645.1 iron dicitrate transport regulator FecR [Methylosinus sp. 3S-1]